jgi:homoserine dehydrogenase
VNGTSNFVLDNMRATGSSVRAAMDSARAGGYAERNSVEDLSGLDSAAKLVLLARLAFGRPVTLDDVEFAGIDDTTVTALADGSVTRLVAAAELEGDRLLLRVEPRFLEPSHPLADVRGADNAVLLETESAGALLFRGPGAGGPATASAVLGDVVEVARLLERDKVGGLS